MNSFQNLREQLRGTRQPSTRLVADSFDFGWRSIQAAITQHNPLPEPMRGIDHSSLIGLTYHLSFPINLTRKIDGEPRNSGLVAPRQICMTPADATPYWSHSDYPEILQVFLDAVIYESAVEEIFGCDGASARLLPQFAIVDPLLEQLAVAITVTLHEGAAEPLYIDSIAQLMAAHLAKRYSSRSSSSRTLPTPFIRTRKMRRVIDYIEANLGTNLSLEVMAAEVEISALYFARSFKAATGLSPHRYVIARRVERAQELLRNTDIPLDQVASTVGFSSKSHLSRWFIHQVGIPPGAYRRSKSSG